MVERGDSQMRGREVPARRGEPGCPGRLLRLQRAAVGAFLFLAAASQPLLAQQSPLEGFDEFVERGIAEWGIPGLAVAVVKDDEVVHARGYGVLEKGNPAAVDEHTLFGVASVSKAFTAGALGILVDEGLLDWDDPVIEHLPDFRLYDPYVTSATTVRDILSHRVGVGRMTGNRIRWLPNRDRSELIRRMRHLEPEQAFRDSYVYSNVMFMVAGELVPAVAGMSWDDFVRTRIFELLGMERSNTSITAFDEGENAAWPHQEIDGEVVPIERRNFDAVGPAASINTSVQEITAWMRLHLGSPGEVDGIRLLEPETLREMHRPQNALADGGLAGPVSSYGLGWRLSTHNGVRTSSHGGATDGMNTTLVLVPEENLGVVVVTNTFNGFMNAVANRVIDRFLGQPDRPWDDAYRNAYLEQYEAVRSSRDSVHAVREEGAEPSLPLDAYTGVYYDSLYADARVSRNEDGGLVLTFWDDPEMVADLEHWHHDTFRAVWRRPEMREEFVRFTRGWDGGVDALHIEWVLRPRLLQVGAYPSNYTREGTLKRVPDADGRNP